MKEWSEVEESCAEDARWEPRDEREDLDPEFNGEPTASCVVEGCRNEGTLEFMGEAVCPDHLADFTESCYDRMMDKEGTDVR